MLGAEQSLETAIPGIFVDAKVSRQFWDATVVLQAYKNEDLLPPTIVVHMGTNGAFSDAQFDQMMAVIGNRQVFFVNAREPRTWETEVNDAPRDRRAEVPERALDRLARLSATRTTTGSSATASTSPAPAPTGYAMLIREHLAGRLLSDAPADAQRLSGGTASRRVAARGSRGRARARCRAA